MKYIIFSLSIITIVCSELVGKSNKYFYITDGNKLLTIGYNHNDDTFAFNHKYIFFRSFDDTLNYLIYVKNDYGLLAYDVVSKHEFIFKYPYDKIIPTQFNKTLYLITQNDTGLYSNKITEPNNIDSTLISRQEFDEFKFSIDENGNMYIVTLNIDSKMLLIAYNLYDKNIKYTREYYLPDAPNINDITPTGVYYMFQKKIFFYKFHKDITEIFSYNVPDISSISHIYGFNESLFVTYTQSNKITSIYKVIDNIAISVDNIVFDHDNNYEYLYVDDFVMMYNTNTNTTMLARPGASVKLYIPAENIKRIYINKEDNNAIEKFIEEPNSLILCENDNIQRLFNPEIHNNKTHDGVYIVSNVICKHNPDLIFMTKNVLYSVIGIIIAIKTFLLSVMYKLTSSSRYNRVPILRNIRS